MAEKKCPKCFSTFNCTNESQGCWCENVTLSLEKLQFLKENYTNCLCRDCLKAFEISELKVIGKL